MLQVSGPQISVSLRSKSAGGMKASQMLLPPKAKVYWWRTASRKFRAAVCQRGSPVAANIQAQALR